LLHCLLQAYIKEKPSGQLLVKWLY